MVCESELIYTRQTDVFQTVSLSSFVFKVMVNVIPAKNAIKGILIKAASVRLDIPPQFWGMEGAVET